MANFTCDWDKKVQGLSEEEVADLEKAKDQLEHYEKIYEIYEYSTMITAWANTLETRIAANNPSVPMNMYRWSGSSHMSEIFPEMEKVLEAYYDLIDDCEEYPDWRRKIEKELGSTVSYLALSLDDVNRNHAVEISEVYRRFDLDKQIFFK
jgi:hypothetical protein